ncbi:hypothetical protein ABPG72_020008 [Tetrahymena utriculariae]
MEVENQQLDQNLLDNSLFVKWGIVISHIVWSKPKQEIADTFQVKLPYVYQILNRFEKDGDFNDQRQSNGGHNKIINEEIQEILREQTTENPSVSSKKLSQIMNQEYDISISSSSVNRARTEQGMYYSPQPNQLHISENTRQSRFFYCKQHRNDKFTNVLFTDESNFQLFYNKNSRWYTQDLENIIPTSTQPINPNLKIMVWGGICLKGKTQLKIYRLDQKETVDSSKYIETLTTYCLPFMNEQYGVGKWKLLQDNARAHVSNQTMTYLKNNKVRTLDHPPYSPDLNPIEKVWAWMKRDLGKVTYSTIENLIDAVQTSWDSVPIEHIKNYISHQINQIQLIEQNEGHFV